MNKQILENQILIMRALRPLLDDVSDKSKSRQPISDLIGALSTEILVTQKIVLPLRKSKDTNHPYVDDKLESLKCPVCEITNVYLKSDLEKDEIECLSCGSVLEAAYKKNL